MFNISRNEDNTVVLEGRLDASQVEAAAVVLDALTTSSVIDFSKLDYISSAGLGILLKTQKRLGSAGQSLTLIHMNKMIRDVFRIARFDLIFKIE